MEFSITHFFSMICISIYVTSGTVQYYKEATEPRVPLSYVEVITSKVLRLPPWLGWPLWNICVTNDHGYVPLVVNTSRSFPHSWLITGFVTRLTRRVSLLEQELLTLPEHLSSPPVFSGVSVSWSLVLYVCFVDHCLSYCTFSFGHCVVCSSWIKILTFLLQQEISIYVIFGTVQQNIFYNRIWPYDQSTLENKNN